MNLSNEQHNKIRLLSDTVLYNEAVDFVRRFVQEHSPLPKSQSSGLLNIAQPNNYPELISFVRHQRDRDWPSGKVDIKEFYTTLDKELMRLQRRVKDEFHLTSSGLSKKLASDEENELMGLLAREFIQHLAAENDLFEVKNRRSYD
jgi:hypothetical protein